MNGLSRAATTVLGTLGLLVVVMPPATGVAGPVGPTEARPGAGRLAVQAEEPSLTLRSIPPWVRPSGRANIDIAVSPAEGDLELGLHLHGAVGSRSEFERTVVGRSLGGLVGSVTVPVSELPEARRGARRILLDLGPPPEEPPPDGTDGDAVNEDGDGSDGDGEDAPPEPISLPVPRAGVHPLVLELFDADGESVDRVVTHLVVLDSEAVRSPLAVAWIWPWEVPHALTPEGGPAPRLEEAVADDGRLAHLVEALGTGADIPLTLAPRPATVDAWAALAARPDLSETTTREAEQPDPAEVVAARLALLRGEASLPRRQLLADTYAETDLPTLARAGLEREIAAQLATGADTLREALGLRPDPRTFLASGLDDRVLAELREAGVDRLVVAPAALQPVFENLTPAQPFEIRSRNRTFLTAAGDPGLAALATGPGDDDDPNEPTADALLAQRLMAGLATVALEAPGERRGVVVLPDSDWSPTSGTLTRVLDGLDGHPALSPVTIDEYFATVPVTEGANAVRQLVEDEPSQLAVSAADVRAIRRNLGAVTSMTESGEATALAERLLLIAESSDWRGAGGRRAAQAYLQGARDQIDRAVSAIHLPGPHTVTLTSRRARIPVTFQNDSTDPVRVRVRLRSDKLRFPEGTTREVVLGPRNTTVQFLVEARTSGTFPMLLEVSSPDGGIGLGAVRLTVRSTAVSGAALAVTVGAGVFLAGWWANHIRRARRQRRAEAAEDEGVAGDGGDR